MEDEEMLVRQEPKTDWSRVFATLGIAGLVVLIIIFAIYLNETIDKGAGRKKLWK
jgi:hypothetical protein